MAEFHILLLEIPALADEREFVVVGPVTGQRVLNILNDSFPKLRSKITIGDPASVSKLEKEPCSRYDISAPPKRPTATTSLRWRN